jgi:hypothetical protein
MARLDQFDTVTRSNAGVEMELKDLRTGRGSGAFITLLGKDSAEFRAILDERSRAYADRGAAGLPLELDADEREQASREMLARCTKGWRGLERADGTELVYSHSAAIDLYATYPAIREQVNVFIADRANFVRA